MRKKRKIINQHIPQSRIQVMAPSTFPSRAKARSHGFQWFRKNGGSHQLRENFLPKTRQPNEASLHQMQKPVLLFSLEDEARSSTFCTVCPSKIHFVHFRRVQVTLSISHEMILFLFRPHPAVIPPFFHYSIHASHVNFHGLFISI